MIFKQWEQVIGLKLPLKTQTRRPDFPYALAQQLWKYDWSYHPDVPWTWKEWRRDFPPLDAQIAEANRILENNTITVAVQLGRGKKAVGRILITKIRRERLFLIDNLDSRREGIVRKHDYFRNISGYGYAGCDAMFYDEREAFRDLWDSIYGEGAWERMKDDDVWVLEFELVK